MAQVQAQFRVLTCSASPSPDGVSELKQGAVAQIRCKLPSDAPTAAYSGYVVSTTAYLTPDPIGLEAANGSATSCATGGGSTNAWCELGNMSIANSQEIGVYIGLVWAIAWGFRALRKSIVIPKETE